MTGSVLVFCTEVRRWFVCAAILCRVMNWRTCSVNTAKFSGSGFSSKFVSCAPLFNLFRVSWAEAFHGPSAQSDQSVGAVVWTLVVRRRTFLNLRPIYDWQVTTLWVNCPLWVSELGQQVACQIIPSYMKYNDACIVLGLPSLHERRHELSERLFHQLTRNTNNCLHCLLPDMPDSTITNRLRSAKQFPMIFAKTDFKIRSLPT